MKRLLPLLALAAALCAPLAASAQSTVQTTIKVVGTCGTAAYTSGKMAYPTQDTTGTLCSSAGSVTATTSATASATATPVVAGTGKPLNEGLFSNLFVSPVDSGGVDATDATNHAVKVNIVAGAAGGGVAGLTAEATASAVAAGTNKPQSEDTTNGSARVVIMTAGSTTPVDMSAAGSGIGATAATVPANAVLKGCRAATAAPTAVTDGQMVAGQCGVEGKTVVLPYSIKETAVRGSTGAITNTSQTSIIASAGGSLKNYITAIQCANSGATTSILTFTDAAATVLINPAGSGGQWTFPIPLATAAATAFQVTPGSSSTSQYCSAQGYTGL